MSFLYKDYAIVAGAVPDEVRVKYNPIASITWETTTGARSIQLLTILPQRHLAYNEARAAAVKAAKAWVDQRLAKSDFQETIYRREF